MGPDAYAGVVDVVSLMLGRRCYSGTPRRPLERSSRGSQYPVLCTGSSALGCYERTRRAFGLQHLASGVVRTLRLAAGEHLSDCSPRDGDRRERTEERTVHEKPRVCPSALCVSPSAACLCRHVTLITSDAAIDMDRGFVSTVYAAAQSHGRAGVLQSRTCRGPGHDGAVTPDGHFPSGSSQHRDARRC